MISDTKLTQDSVSCQPVPSLNIHIIDLPAITLQIPHPSLSSCEFTSKYAAASFPDMPTALPLRCCLQPVGIHRMSEHITAEEG